MKHCGCAGWILAGVVAGLPYVCAAQLVLGLTLKHSEYLQGETVVAAVDIENRSRNPLVVARDVEVLPKMSFEFESKGKGEVAKGRSGDLPAILRDLYIIPGKKESLEVELNRWYDLSPMGQFLVTAVVEWGGKRYRSNTVVLEVVRGLEIAAVGLASPEDSGQWLNYRVRYWSRDRVEHGFLVVEDEKNVNYGVFDMGPIIRVIMPKVQVAADGMVEVVHQTGPDHFAHSFFRVAADGVTYVRRTYSRAGGLQESR